MLKFTCARLFHQLLNCAVNMTEKGEVNLAGAKQSKGVWLVKVPKYLAQQWDKAAEKGEVGKISIGTKQGKTEVCFSLNEELTALGAVGEKDVPLQVPRHHPFTMNSVGGQTMAVFSLGVKDEISLEGMVVHKAECRPVVTDNYMKLKKVQMKESLKPQRLSQQLERAITTAFKPVANHDFNVEYEKKKKSEGKMVRAERQVVLDMLFTAFEKHQYYNIKNLVDITKQPVTYLKEIMREIGTYNSKGAHKSTWELKPEYRHYQSGEEEEEMQTA
ncbi:general transcription factor IIF subunit 2-like isoform X2 [Dunckerocampus dactyliophorus]|uniref:general transcription factor IIF subunit 2-like isoform X2 n=1 Tax=Dunckerocampus dactyliophorus TaxID=161453 RepID=UPI002404E9A7|nr:general transcription factor IIF subunit 2-like isoform X2 [Dunckerocampus dactyliophorus]